MAVPATLLEKVQSLVAAQDITIVPNDNIVYFLNNGSRFAINSLPKARQDAFTEYVVGTGDATPSTVQSVSVLDSQLITHVHRYDKIKNVSYVAKEIDDTQRYANELSTLFAATKVFPQWYRDRDSVYIKPPLIVDDEIRVAAVTIPVINSSTATYFDGLENAVVYYAVALTIRASVDYSLMDLASQISSLISDIGTYMPDIDFGVGGEYAEMLEALENAKRLVIKTSGWTEPSTVPPPATQFLDEEDSEMVESSVASAREEIERALSYVKSLTDINSIDAQKVATVASALGAAGQSLNAVYQSANNYYQMAVSEVATFIAAETPGQQAQPQKESQDDSN
jgi:hypothetical protein